MKPALTNTPVPIMVPMFTPTPVHSPRRGRVLVTGELYTSRLARAVHIDRRMRRVVAALLALCCSTFAGVGAVARADAGGVHHRLETPRGAVHVWQPAKALRAQSGVVVYVHGYYTDVDRAWRDHRLDEQFAHSGRDALFIVPEAPASADDEVVWPALGDLLRAVAAEVGPLPDGPVVIAGHSGAYRTLVSWLEYGPVEDVILLDGLYGNEEDFAEWLTAARGHERHRLTLVTSDTARWAGPFVRRFPGATSLARLPARWGGERDDALVELRPPGVGHMEVVTGGRALPLALQRTRLAAW
jgi:hypothetical protein